MFEHTPFRFQPVPIDALATDAVENIDVTFAPLKAAVLVFHPWDLPELATLHTNAAAVDLLPVLRALLARLESGALRMPIPDHHAGLTHALALERQRNSYLADQNAKLFQEVEALRAALVDAGRVRLGGYAPTLPP